VGTRDVFVLSSPSLLTEWGELGNWAGTIKRESFYMSAIVPAPTRYISFANGT
jgi:hypothetical protein